MTATSAVVDPDISEKNIENTTTTCDSPPLIWPTSGRDRLGIGTTTLAELMSSPPGRASGIPSSASESTPSWRSTAMAGDGADRRTGQPNTPASSENGTG